MRRSPRGFTLAEVLVAITIVTVGLGGITAMLQLAAASRGEGSHRTVAIFLADERAEHLRGVIWNAADDCLGVSPSVALPPVTSTCPEAGVDHVSFPDEDAGALRAPFETFTRIVRVQACASLATCPVVSPDLRLVSIAIGRGPLDLQILTLRGLIAKRL